jgi:hypothetical protein
MSNKRQLIARAGAACLIIFLAIMPILGRAQSSGDELALKLRNNVVKITAKRESGESAHGFGFIVGKQRDQFYIVTANHVVRSNRPGGASKSVKLKFYSDPGRTYPAVLLETFYGKPQDFAVVQVTAPANISWESEALVSLLSIKAGMRGEKVWFIGRSGKWYIPTIPGRINSEKPDLHSIIQVDIVSVRVGTSGAPLITENGIIGMIIEDEVGSARAVSIEAIKAAFEEWRYPWSLRAIRDQKGPIPKAASPQEKTPSLAKLAPESPSPKAEPPDQPPDRGYRVAVMPLQLRNDASRYKLIFNRLIEESIAETEFFGDYRFYDLNSRHKTSQSEIIFNQTLMNKLWLKKGFFSKPEPNTSFIIQLGNQLGVDAVLIFSANVIDLGKDRIKALLVDVKRKNIYSSSGLTDFALTEDTDQILEASSDTKKITKKVFAEYKNKYQQ